MLSKVAVGASLRDEMGCYMLHRQPSPRHACWHAAFVRATHVAPLVKVTSTLQAQASTLS
jgi:hypothetical protein